MMFSAGGSRVELFSRSAGSREAARRFVGAPPRCPRAARPRRQNGGHGGAVRRAGARHGHGVADRRSGVRRPGAQEAGVPRFGRLAESDAILATNSSSYPSSRLLDAVESPERLLNVHFQMPPELIGAEPCRAAGPTPRSSTPSPGGCRRYGFVPITVIRESVGFLFNRISAAIERECLIVVAEGVSTPEEVDRIWRLSLGTALGPSG